MAGAQTGQVEILSRSRLTYPACDVQVVGRTCCTNADVKFPTPLQLGILPPSQRTAPSSHKRPQFVDRRPAVGAHFRVIPPRRSWGGVFAVFRLPTNLCRRWTAARVVDFPDGTCCTQGQQRELEHRRWKRNGLCAEGQAIRGKTTVDGR